MKFLRPKELPAKVGLSLATIWRLQKKGQFPQRRRISAGAVAYIESEIDEWMKNRESAG